MTDKIRSCNSSIPEKNWERIFGNKKEEKVKYKKDDEIELKNGDIIIFEQEGLGVETVYFCGHYKDDKENKIGSVAVLYSAIKEQK